MTTTPNPRRVAVIGGGFTGAAVAVHLARAAQAAGAPIAIDVVEPRVELGAGLAYGSAGADHRINVPSDRMDVFREDPAHFTRWLRETGAYERDAEALTGDAHHYSRRDDFGRYVTALVRETNDAPASAARIRHVRASAQGIARAAEGGYLVTLDDGTEPAFDAVVVTVSHAAPAFPWAVSDPVAAHAGLIRDPWRAGALDGISSDATVVIAGTGLTMCDMVVSLRRQGHRGRILAISRRALLPRVHTGFTDGFDLLRGEPLPRTGLALLRLVRRRVDDAEREGLGWRAALDATRRSLPAIWAGLPIAQRAHVVRRLRAWWDVHRFRMAPQVSALIEAGRAEGWLDVQAGRLRGVDEAGDALAVQWSDRAGAPHVERCDAFINCIGPDSDLRRSALPFFRSLLGSGLARVDPLRLGLETDQQGCVIDGPGRADPWLRAAGPLARASVGEVTGVSEASAHARRVAEDLAARLFAGMFARGSERAPVIPPRTSSETLPVPPEAERP